MMNRAARYKDFVDKSTARHNGKYDYSKVKYHNSSTRVIIICPTHGQFIQTPRSHCEGHGCPSCSSNHLKTPSKFVEDARSIHGDTYGYDLVVYKNRKSHVTIVCSIHGSFQQTPNNHLHGNGCPACGRLRLSESCSRIISTRISDGSFNPNCNHLNGWYDSNKAGRVYYRSSYELRFYTMLDQDSRVVRYEVEKHRVPYVFDGKTKTYIPDVEVFFNGRKSLVCEIKPRARVSEPQNSAKFTAAIDHFSRLCIDFVVITPERFVDHVIDFEA